MTAIDRSIRPAKHTIDQVHFLEPEIFTLSNGVKVHGLKATGQDIIKTDFVFDGGNLKGDNPLVGSAATNLIFTAANGKNSEDLNEEFDFYGAFNGKSSHYTDFTVTNYCLTRHSEKVFNLLAESLDKAEFIEHELDIYKFVKVQDLSVSKQKTSYLARKSFNAAVFGNHTYGFMADEADYKALDINSIGAFFHSSKSLKYIILSGAYTQETINQLEKMFGHFGYGSTALSREEITGAAEKEILVPKTGAVQCTLRLGFTTINRTHPDYQKLGILVTLLGGFFGSRLMKNIREDKGYTYGIHVGITSFPDTGLLYIQTDVKKDVYPSAIDEIFKEIKRLRDEPVTDEEIEVLANYSMGSFLRSIDGPFALSEKYKTLLDFGQDYNYYHTYLHLLKNINAEELAQTARTYFVDENIYRVVAGV